MEHCTSTSNAAAMRNHDGSAMLDDHGNVVYRSQFLSTHPLRGDCNERSQGGKLLTYITGDGVIRTMNAAFGHDGWTTTITRERQVDCEFNKGKWVVGYVATVKITLLESGASHEDCGCGEGIHESKLKALDNAMKSAVTDAMKRAARHFGERLGNALYVPGNGMQRAPIDNRMALKDLEQQETRDLFGNQKILHVLRAKHIQDAAAHQSVDKNQDIAGETPRTNSPSGTHGQEQTTSAHQAVPTLERQTTPPLLAAVTWPPHGNNRGNSSPLQIGHGFTRASELGTTTATVTPGQQPTITQGTSPQHFRASSHDSMNTSPPNKTSPTSRPSPPPMPRCPPVNTQQSPAYNNVTQATKRQKVVHNPYHH